MTEHTVTKVDERDDRFTLVLTCDDIEFSRATFSQAVSLDRTNEFINAEMRTHMHEVHPELVHTPEDDPPISRPEGFSASERASTGDPLLDLFGIEHVEGLHGYAIAVSVLEPPSDEVITAARKLLARNYARFICNENKPLTPYTIHGPAVHYGEYVMMWTAIAL